MSLRGPFIINVKVFSFMLLPLCACPSIHSIQDLSKFLSFIFSMDKTIEMSFDNNESNKTFCTENARRAFIILHLSSLFCDSGCLSICLSVFVSAVLSSICLPTSVCLLMLLLPRTHYCSKCTFDSILLVCLSVRLSLCLLFICACFLSVFFSLCCFVCLPDCLCV